MVSLVVLAAVFFVLAIITGFLGVNGLHGIPAYFVGGLSVLFIVLAVFSILLWRVVQNLITFFRNDTNSISKG